VTSVTITNAVNSASAGQVVSIPAGSFSIAGVTAGVSNISVRGAGANATFLTLSGSNAGCNGANAFFCVWNGDGNWWGGPDNGPVSWTALSYAQGATTITLASHANLKVGTLMILVQEDDTSNSGTGWLNCGKEASFCSQQGASNSQWATDFYSGNGATEAQNVTVTACGTSTPGAACTSNTVTFTPGLHAPNWTSAKNPVAFWPTDLPLTGVGIENLSFDCSGQNVQCIVFWGDTDSWYINSRTKSVGSNHVGLEMSNHITVQSNYMYGGSGSSEGYGVNSENGSADNLVVNNICNHNANCMVAEGGDSGTVFAYNYAIDDFFGPGQYQQGPMTHSAGNHMELWEGNQVLDIQNDIIHGPSNAGTLYRNYITGLDPITAANNGGQTKSIGTTAVNIGASNRYYNVVANVLGTSGFHTLYADAAPSTSACTLANEWTSVFPVYLLGYSDQWGGAYTSGCGQGSPNINNDLAVGTTLMRWGNYDVVNAAVREVSGENGSGANTYPALTSPATSFPATFFLASEPSWWVFPSGTAAPWPGNGPDVTGGDVAGVGGHANLNPAANCYLNVMGGLTNGASGWLTFNPSSCYVASGPSYTWTPTVSPSGGGTITGTNCGAGSYASGTTIGACTAMAATGYSLASPIWTGVSGSAGCTGSTNPCASFSITANSGATASFTLNSYTLSTATAGTGTGTVSGCAGTVAYGASYSCTVTPGTGSTLASVTGCSGSGTTTYTGTMPASNCTVTATFNLINYTLSTAAAGTGSGTITGCAGSYTYGASYSCTVTAGTGSTLTTVSGCGGTGTSPYTGTMPASSCTVTGTFTLNTYTVTPSAGTGGSISPATAQTVNYGSTTVFTVTPNAGYSISAVTGCGGSLVGTTYTTGSITSNCAVSATFTTGSAAAPVLLQTLNMHGYPPVMMWRLAPSAGATGQTFWVATVASLTAKCPAAGASAYKAVDALSGTATSFTDSGETAGTYMCCVDSETNGGYSPVTGPVLVPVAI
jgi:hypothetical protein